MPRVPPRPRYEIVLIAPNVTCTWCHPNAATQSARLVSLLVIRPRIVVSSVSNEGVIQLTYDKNWPEELWPTEGFTG